MKVIPFEQVKDTLRPGDLVAFGGSGFLSNGIKVFSHSPISHIAMVDEDPTKIIESTIIGKVSGPQVNDLATRLAGYDKGGKAWVLYLSDKERELLDFKAMFDFGRARIAAGDKYEKQELIEDAVDTFVNIPFPDDPHASVCSEFVAELLQAGGQAFTHPTFGLKPQQLAEMAIFSGCQQILGESTVIPQFNSL
jgi:hypothetical protein